MPSTDPLDRAQELTEEMLQRSLAQRKPEAPGAVGYCLNCFEDVNEGVRWCDAECRDDWEITNANSRTR